MEAAGRRWLALRALPPVCRLPCSDSYFVYSVEVLPEALTVAVLVWTAVVPAVGGGRPLGEFLPTLFTEQLIRGALVPVEFELKFTRECPVAVPTDMGHYPWTLGPDI